MDIETLLPFAFIGLFLVVAVFAVMAGLRQQERARNNLRALADRLRLQVREPAKRPFLGKPIPEIAGDHRGRRLRIYAYATGSGKNRTQWCAIGCPVRNSAGLSLRVSGENLLTRAGRKLGIDDVAVGDAEFDRRFYLKSNKPAFIRAALIPEIRARLAEAWNQGARGSVSADGAEVKYAETGNFSNDKVAKRFPVLAEVVCDLAEVVEACEE